MKKLKSNRKSEEKLEMYSSMWMLEFELRLGLFVDGFKTGHSSFVVGSGVLEMSY